MYLVGLGLMFDDNTTDDPPLANTCSATRYQLCPDFTGGSMHAYANYFDGSLLYLTKSIWKTRTLSSRHTMPPIQMSPSFRPAK